MKWSYHNEEHGQARGGLRDYLFAAGYPLNAFLDEVWDAWRCSHDGAAPSSDEYFAAVTDALRAPRTVKIDKPNLNGVRVLSLDELTGADEAEVRAAAYSYYGYCNPSVADEIVIDPSPPHGE